MNTRRITQSLGHREQHMSRSLAVVLLLSLVALMAIGLGVLSVLTATGVTTTSSVTSHSLPALSGRTIGAAAIALGSAIVLAAIGVLCIIVAIKPGWRARTRLDDDRVALFVDNGVLASDLSRAARTEHSVGGAEVRSLVGRRSATVHVRPVSGVPVDRDALSRTLGEQMAAVHPRKPIRVAARISSSGTVER